MKKVLKLIAAVFLIGTFVLTFGAIFRQETYPAEMKKTVKNEVLHSYYEQNGKAPDAYTHEPIDSFDYEGNIQAKHLTYIPELSQVQISVRYGRVAFENIADRYELDSVPTVDDHRVHFKLRALVIADGAFSNDDKKLTDDEILESVIIEKSSAVDLRSGRHQYHRFVFDGVDFSKYNCLYLDLYYGDEADPYTSIIIYHSDAAKYADPVKITDADCEMP